MKNWTEQFAGRAFSGQVTITQREFEDIQLDAWKAGMRKAMKIAHDGDRHWDADTITNFIEQYMLNTDTLYPREDV